MPRGGRGGEGVAHDFERVSNDADSHELLSVVAAVHHKGVGETLNDGAIGLAEAFDGIASGRVRDVDGGADLNVVAVGEHLVSQYPCQPAFQSRVKKRRASKPVVIAALSPCEFQAPDSTHVNEISRTSTSSYDHLLKSLMEPISSVTSLGRTMYPLGFSTSTSAVSDMLGDCC